MRRIPITALSACLAFVTVIALTRCAPAFATEPAIATEHSLHVPGPDDFFPRQG